MLENVRRYNVIALLSPSAYRRSRHLRKLCAHLMHPCPRAIECMRRRYARRTIARTKESLQSGRQVVRFRVKGHERHLARGRHRRQARRRGTQADLRLEPEHHLHPYLALHQKEGRRTPRTRLQVPCARVAQEHPGRRDRRVIDRMFGGSADMLLAALVEREKISQGVLDHLCATVANAM